MDPKLRELAAEAAAAVTGAGSASAGKAAAYARDLRAQLRQRPAGVYAYVPAAFGGQVGQTGEGEPFTFVVGCTCTS